jgi:glyoxylase-like metal-dependent hydrolase (beta-lactamase superfamily II)
MEVEQVDVLREAGRIAEVNGEIELVAGVSVVPTGGHTRGSQAVLIGRRPPPNRSNDGETRAIFWGDLIPTRWQLPVRWTSSYDDYPVAAVEARRELLGRAATEAWWCYFTHDPGELPIRIEESERGYRERQPT